MDKHYEFESKELAFKKPSKEVKLTKANEIENPEIRDLQTSAINLSSQEKIGSAQEGVTISNIYTEADTENSAIQLDVESQAEVKKFTERSRSWISNYLSAKAKVDAWTRAKKGKTRRNRRSVSSSSVTALTQGERTAIWELYKLFEELEKAREKLVPKFQQIAKTESTFSTLKNDRPQQSNVETKLKAINWTNQREIKYENPRPRQRLGRAATPQISWTDWKEWTHNPYSLFLENQQDYNSLISKIQQIKSNLQVQQRRGFFTSGARSYVYPPSSVREEQRKLEEAKSDFSANVAFKLLDWMGQSLQLAQ
ncbi:hypothetical protein [Candidatus Mycoplasma haematominutum]|uniref:hypothetical protein n=1 Tax=Candidatus Mycoplasma haematominutum TaxID=209446 RepID=UPI0003122064|nr:hypothetical protein [Candidatus Mycoplasma haematominutum]